MISQADIQGIYARHVDTVYRVCFAYLGNRADTEDAVQDVFVKLMRANDRFTSDEHVKAWLIRVAVNRCKDMLRSSSRGVLPFEQAPEPVSPDSSVNETLDAVMRLSPTYKDVVYLYYYEGYSTEEIARILQRPASTVRGQLSEARTILRGKLGGDWS